MKNIILIFLIVSLISSVSCREESTEADDDTFKAAYESSDEHASAVSSGMVSANNNFAGRIFRSMSAGEPGKNIMISPLSISIALSMILNGASGENLVEMKDVLGFETMELAVINRQFSDLIASLESADKDMLLSIADSIWIRLSFEPRVYRSFLNVLQDYFDAESHALDFSDPASVDTINSWVSENTMGKIDKIIDKIPEETVMYLINAIYFKGTWTTTFDSELTYDGTFILKNGDTKSVRLMTFKNDQEFKFFSSEYGVENGYSAVRLPYGRDKVAFYGFIPSSGTLDDFIDNMVDSGLDNFFSNLTAMEIPVILPKFKFEYEKELNDILKSLGMTKAFAAGGLLNLAQDGENLVISKAKHKTFIEVNEAGTEAAAVTSIEVGETCAPDGFFAIKPFLFVIRDDRSGTILFIGKVEDPSLTN